MHTRFLGMELDANLKTQINHALAIALQGIKSATLSKEAVAELLTAGQPPLLCNRRFHGFNFSRSVLHHCSCHSPAGNFMFQLASFDILIMLTIYDQLFIFLLEWAAESMSRPGSSHSSTVRLLCNAFAQYHGRTRRDFCLTFASRV